MISVYAGAGMCNCVAMSNRPRRKLKFDRTVPRAALSRNRASLNFSRSISTAKPPQWLRSDFGPPNS